MLTTKINVKENARHIQKTLYSQELNTAGFHNTEKKHSIGANKFAPFIYNTPHTFLVMIS